MPTAAHLYYFAHGAENKSRPPVILIHGAGGAHLHWPPQVRRLPGQRIFAVDLPGHGKSEGVGGQAINDYAQNVLELIRAINLRAAVIVGHSMGSAVALALALDFPRLVLGLGLLGSGAKLRVDPAILQSAADPSTFQSAVQLVISYSYSPHADARLKELGAQRMAETRPAVLYGDFLACNAFNVTDRLGNISTPTLILCGTEDKLTPLKYSEFLRDQIPGAHLETIGGAGHMVMLEQPDIVAKALAGFLNTIPYQLGQ